MRLCIGTSKGIVILDPARGGIPLMVLADPSAVWCMAQDAIDPHLIYAGSTSHVRGKGTLARSADGGRTWIDITPGPAREEEVWAIATSPAMADCVMVGTSHARLFRSEDRGRIFKECDGFLKIPGRDRWTFPPPPHIPHVRSIAFDPREPSTLYAGVEEGGVFRSRDGGATFAAVNDGLFADVHAVAVDARDSRRLYATTGAGFYRSADAGQSWKKITRRLSRSYTIPLLLDGVGGETIFIVAAAGPPPTWWASAVSGADAILFRSNDRGESFAAVSPEQGFGRGMPMRLRRDPENGGIFAVSNDGSVSRASADGSVIDIIAEKLPPAFDFATIP